MRDSDSLRVASLFVALFVLPAFPEIAETRTTIVFADLRTEWRLTPFNNVGHQVLGLPFSHFELGKMAVGRDMAVGQNRFGIPFWLVGELACSLGERALDFDPWPHWAPQHPIYQSSL